MTLSASFDKKFQAEFEKYMEKIKMEVTEGTRGSVYPTIKRFGLRPGDSPNNGFYLPTHVQQNLSPAQSAEIIANHFSQISQEYTALDINNLPLQLQSFLQADDSQNMPKLSVQAVHARII